MKLPHSVGGALRAYPDYKPSGVEWLGDVPAHWEINRLRNVGEAIIGLTYDPQDVVGEGEGILVLRASNILDGRIVYRDKVFVRCSVPRRLITHVGDILLCSRSGSRALIGKSARIELESAGVTFGAFMTVFRSSINSYLYHVFNSKLFEHQSGAFLTSTINQLTLSILYNIKIPLPTLTEQNAIVRYLDHVDGRIRRYIEAKEKLVALLAEEKQAVIHQAVTRGIDANVRLKPSGVEWLGDVPAHWEVRRLGDSICGCVNGVWGADPNGADDLPCVRVADFNRQKWRIGIPIPTIRAIAPNERRRRILESGDLLLEKSGGGDRQPVGAVVLFEHNTQAVCSNFVARMPVRENFDSVYLVFLHASLYAIGLNRRSIKQTTGIQNLDSAAYLAESVAFPPLAEQVAIAAYLDREAARIDAAAARARRQVELMREYRERLIADVVTGKLDVRGAAVALPDGGGPSSVEV